MRRVRIALFISQLTPLRYSLLREDGFEKANPVLRGTKRAFACNFMGGHVLDRLWRR